MCLRRRPISRVENVPNDHANVALAILASVRLRCFAPAAIEQRNARCHARRLALAVRGDAAELLDSGLGPLPRKRTNIEGRFCHLFLTP